MQFFDFEPHHIGLHVMPGHPSRLIAYSSGFSAGTTEMEILGR
jgi:hypothetical protein